jgi:hypothetical protein
MELFQLLLSERGLHILIADDLFQLMNDLLFVAPLRWLVTLGAPLMARVAGRE